MQEKKNIHKLDLHLYQPQPSIVIIDSQQSLRGCNSPKFLFMFYFHLFPVNCSTHDKILPQLCKDN